MKNRIEAMILYHLMKDEVYTRKVLPFLKLEYFSERVENILFKLIKEFIDKYNSQPTVEAIAIELDKERKSLQEDDVKQIITYIKEALIPECEKPDANWLLTETEKWCKNRAVYNAITKSIAIYDGNDKDNTTDAIPQIITEALSVCFNANIGHDYLNDSDIRYEFYHEEEAKLPFDIDLLNTITRGGIKRKTLFMLLAGTNVGKSLALCHFAASNLADGKNVLYITLEMSEEEVSKRIDANLLNVSMEELEKINKSSFDQKIMRLKGKTNGKLIIKEYPTASAHAGHFRHLLHELNLKKNFKPDVIVLDYINIATSSRLKANGNVNSYTFVLSISQEIRGLAAEFDIPIISATQTNRKGQVNSDLDFDDVSESHGLSGMADYIMGMSTSEELDKLNQILFKQIKNRYGDKSKFRRFVVGIDRDKMRLFNVEQKAQEELCKEAVDDTPAFDKTAFGSKMETKGGLTDFEDDDDDLF